MNETVLMVDGTNLVMRSLFAMKGKTLSASVEGEEVPTGAINTFLNTLAKYVRMTDPDRMVVCWDGGRSEFRTRLYPDYKASRNDRVELDGKATAFDLAKEVLSLMGVYHLEILQVEADDLIGAYWREHKGQDNVVLLSGDKDFLQLVEEEAGVATILLRPGGNPERWDADEVFDQMGCEASDLPNVMALAGDKVDGVPGVPGVAHKTAVKLLEKYDWSLWQLLQAGEKKLAGHEDDVMLFRKLVNLRQTGEWDAHEFITGPVPLFLPTDHTSIVWSSLLDWLAMYDMRVIGERLRSGDFWRTSNQQLRLTT